jgi:hypothetical protein
MLTTPRLILAAAVISSVLALPAMAAAQGHGGGHAGAAHGGAVAVPHAGVAVPRGPVGATAYHYPYYGYGRYPYYGYGHYPYYPYYPYYGGVSIGIGFSYGYPWGWGSFGFGWGGYPYYGYGYPYYGYYPYYPYPAAYNVAAAPPSGGIRIDVPQRDAEVTVDGNFAGTVEDFNGRSQALPLSPGSHHIEIHANGFETASFDVNVDSGRTITYRSSLRPAQP